MCRHMTTRFPKTSGRRHRGTEWGISASSKQAPLRREAQQTSHAGSKPEAREDGRKAITAPELLTMRNTNKTLKSHITFFKS